MKRLEMFGRNLVFCAGIVLLVATVVYLCSLAPIAAAAGPYSRLDQHQIPSRNEGHPLQGYRPSSANSGRGGGPLITTKKEYPILFHPAMVRAILRRVEAADAAVFRQPSPCRGFPPVLGR